MRRVFVGNLDFSIDEPELQELFSTKGTVDSVKVIRDLESGRSRGFAFVVMATDEDARRAISELNGQRLRERSITVSEARPKPQRSPELAGQGYGRR